MTSEIPTKQNAIITGTSLGPESHGIFSCMIYLDLEHGSQGFGGYAMEEPIKRGDGRTERMGTAYGMEFIRRILKTAEVDTWEKLKGVNIRALTTHSKIIAIGHIRKDIWFNPEKDLAHFFPNEKL